MLFNKVFGNRFMPMMDADPPGGGGGGTPTPPAPAPTPTPAAIDYEKLAGIIAGKQSVTEKQVLTGYLKQLGLSEEEMKTAADSFKEYKAKSQPNTDELKNELTAAKQAVVDAQLEIKSISLASELGIDMKSMPFVLKLADMKDVVTDGKIDDAKLKAAVEKVLTDVPSFKGTSNQEPGPGFRKVGGEPGKGGAGTADDTLRRVMGLKDKKE